MATKAEERALLAVACPWCGAGVGTRCGRQVGRYRTTPSTLDGGSHDARWLKAGLGPAPVISAAVLAHREPQEPPLLVASAAAQEERPW